MPTKYVVVLGSLLSGLGKGVITSSILKLLDFYNYTALPTKFDGYLNYDCGTMNPYQHGEVYVLDDKSEVDMDFGIYERFLSKSLTGDLSITGGKLFGAIISKERQGGYLGETVQIIPHLTNEIIDRIEKLADSKRPDVLVIEVGGTVGDIENSYFIEAMRQLSLKHEVVFINLTYLPTLDVVGEQKTKPAQIGFRLLLQDGIRPNFVVCRMNSKLEESKREKLALFANMGKERIIDDPDQPTVYNLPLHFMEVGFDKLLIKDLGLKERAPSAKKVAAWRETVKKVINPKTQVNIAIVGKYTNLRDSYASVKEAITHAGARTSARPNITWIESSDFENEKADYSLLQKMDGIIVTGGFGSRGTEGMINIIKYARENKVPYLGICLGMQLMVVEYARNVAGLKGANSSEFDPMSKHKVIVLLDSQKQITDKGGTMRLGAQECILPEPDSIARKAYKSDTATERHRHRYEFNNHYAEVLEGSGLKITGLTTDKKLVEFVEWSKGGFGIGTQSHPELKSRFEEPAPLFVSLLEAAKEHCKD
ncbi:MAG: CTP synthase [Candidatus Micrarchaeota archaeon]|nr:CTP synthase [Candidatus Micrarchaeota archaeon]MDE1833755.1 CTP synthase [Candidatus Micrarchaeota archaeon]MDE1859936.1 CTP synthase [Candidatus Micrarchaeota archaeon]